MFLLRQIPAPKPAPAYLMCLTKPSPHTPPKASSPLAKTLPASPPIPTIHILNTVKKIISPHITHSVRANSALFASFPPFSTPLPPYTLRFISPQHSIITHYLSVIYKSVHPLVIPSIPFLSPSRFEPFPCQLSVFIVTLS